MNMPADPAPSARVFEDTRIAGTIIAAASVASVLLMFRHPSVASHAMADVIAEVTAKAAIDRFVHGGLIALMATLLFGFVDLSRLLGLRRPSVRAALLAYAIGTGAMMGAALISGFVVPDLASRYSSASPAELETFRSLAILSTIGNQTLAHFGVTAMSLAVFLWSLAFLRGPRTVAWIGVLGLLVAAGPVLALLAGVIELRVTGMTLVVGCQTLWNLAVSVPMMRRTMDGPSPA